MAQVVETERQQETLVRYETRDGVALIRLDDPPANTYTYEMMRQLDEAVLEARMDDAVHVLVVTGAGEKFFCAGADIRMLQSATPAFKYAFCLHANETLCRLEQTPKLVIAALNGHTVGGGLEVALACDLRLARRGAGAIGLPEVALGVLPGTGGTQRLTRVVGKARALDLMLTGRLFSFEEGAAMGIVQQVLEGEDFLSQVRAYVAQFLPPGRASKAVGLIKRAVQTGAELPFQDALALERELQQQLFQSDDAKEGLTAYVEKRQAKFTGK